MPIYDVYAEKEWSTQMDAKVISMWTSPADSTQKIRARWRHPAFFSCKEVDVFCTRISPLEGI